MNGRFPSAAVAKAYPIAVWSRPPSPVLTAVTIARSLDRKAAALVESVSKNHGFTDGNKRTTLILLDLLLERSGYSLVPLPSDKSIGEAAEDMLLALVQHRLSFEDIVVWVERRRRRN
jgi:prophage maintenance system killer protein